MESTSVIETVGAVVDAVGVAAVVIGILVSSAMAASAMLRRQPAESIYSRFGQRLGRSILLGLELLVAADIIRTVAVTPSLRSVGVLALIVLIRTFLSFSLELEISGRWPWQKEPAAAVSPAPAGGPTDGPTGGPADGPAGTAPR